MRIRTDEHGDAADLIPARRGAAATQLNTAQPGAPRARLLLFIDHYQSK